MSKGMIGFLSLSEVRGPKNDLDEKLAGENGPEWLERLKKMLRLDSFIISLGDGQTKANLLATYNWVGDVTRAFVNSDQFRFSATREDVDLEFIDGTDFDHDPSSQDVLDEFVRRGLEEPTEEDALRYGATCPEGKDKRSVVFLHKKNRWRGPGGRLGVLVFGWDGSRRGLRYGWFDDTWDRQGYRFAGRRPRK